MTSDFSYYEPSILFILLHDLALPPIAMLLPCCILGGNLLIGHHHQRWGSFLLWILYSYNFQLFVQRKECSRSCKLTSSCDPEEIPSLSL